MPEGYTQEFWFRAIELAMYSPKRCEQCFVLNGEEITRAIRPKKRTYAVVRVALRKGKTIDRSNLGLFCTKCRRGDREVKTSREAIEKLILPLFGDP